MLRAGHEVAMDLSFESGDNGRRMGCMQCEYVHASWEIRVREIRSRTAGDMAGAVARRAVSGRGRVQRDGAVVASCGRVAQHVWGVCVLGDAFSGGFER